MPVTAEVTTYDVEVMCAGARLPDEIARTLLEVDIEATYNRPDLCLVRFNLEANQDPPRALDVGNELKISVTGRGASTQKSVIFLGEITAIEFEYVEKFAVCVVQAQDVMHRLFRGNKHQTFVEQTYSDIARKLVRESGVTPGEIGSTSIVHQHLIQHDETNGDLLTRLANEVNFYLKAEDKKVNVRKVGTAQPSGVTLEHGKHLISLSVRVTTASQLAKATVRGWDSKQKKEVVAEATAATARKDSKVANAVSAMKGVGETTFASNGPQGHLADIAKAAVERSVEPNLQVDGVCHGEPKLKVDGTVTLAKVSERFNGDYRISSVRHRYSQSQGLVTEFSCRGATEQSLSGLVVQAASSERAVGGGGTLDGCVIGIVTSNTDPDKIGRVKVKFPSLDGALESYWYRVVLPGAGGSGAAHGWYLLPEVNDEVLVIFERNDPRLGYVIGGLFNGKDKPPIEQAKAVENGKVNQHGFFMKNGGGLRFDEKKGAEVFQVQSSKDPNFDLKFEETKGLTITNKTTGNVITVTADGNITIESKQGNISLSAAAGDIVMKAVNIKLESKAGAEMKGATVKIEGQASTAVSSTGTTEVKGSLVKIN